MGIFSRGGSGPSEPAQPTGGADGRGTAKPQEAPHMAPFERIDYTDKGGTPASEVSYTAVDTDSRVETIAQGGGTNISVSPFKRNR
jgi:hypothetical protein